MNVDLAQMAIDRLQAVAVVDDDAVAVDSERCGPNHASVIRCLHPDVLRARQVVAKMRLLINLLTLVNVIADVGEVGFDLCVWLLQKGLRPEKRRLCFCL